MLALRHLYEWAGKPAVRTISQWILADDNLPSTLSRDFVSRTLRGDVPRWHNLKSLVHVLVEHQAVGESDVTAVLTRLHELWVRADASPLPGSESAAEQDLVRRLRDQVAERLNQQRRQDQVNGILPMSAEDEQEYARSLIVQVLEDHARSELSEGRTPPTPEDDARTAPTILASLFDDSRTD